MAKRDQAQKGPSAKRDQYPKGTMAKSSINFVKLKNFVDILILKTLANRNHVTRICVNRELIVSISNQYRQDYMMEILFIDIYDLLLLV